MVIGCCGAGKSTFAKRLHAVTGIELIHLDQHYWKPGWVESDPVEWKAKVESLAAGPRWIIDGNYGGTIDLRIGRADTILYFDFPTWKCLWRITQRILKYRGTERPDMPPGCRERFDLDFYHYVATFNLMRRKNLLRKLAAVEGEKRVVIFRNDGEAERFLERLAV